MVEVLQVAVGASNAGGALHCSAGHSAICHVLPMLGLRGSIFASFFPPLESHRCLPRTENADETEVATVTWSNQFLSFSL